jgi:hypothetical protein
VTEDGKYLEINVTKGCDPTNMVFYSELTPGMEITGKLPLLPLFNKSDAKYDVIL